MPTRFEPTAIPQNKALVEGSSRLITVFNLQTDHQNPTPKDFTKDGPDLSWKHPVDVTISKSEPILSVLMHYSVGIKRVVPKAPEFPKIFCGGRGMRGEPVRCSLGPSPVIFHRAGTLL
jgi:hypothetical protein